MYIANPQKLSKTITLNKRLGEYIIKRNDKIPVLYKDSKNYIFSETYELKRILEGLPFYIKLLYM
jgi:hypothetical protein